MDIKKPATQVTHQLSRAENASQQTNKGSNGSRKLAIVLILVVVIALAGFAGYGYSKLSANSTNFNDSIQKDRFQAVFLTNGQVYFGKVQNVEGSYVKLKNIYYLQVQQSVQPSTSNPEKSSSSDSQVSLTKLGKELHGPTDQMYISRSEVLFWENLEKNSTVVKAITDYEKK